MNLFDLPKGTIEDESVLWPQLLPSGRVNQFWYRAGLDIARLHRLRGPAVVYSNGEEEWYRDDKEYQPTFHEKMLWELRKKNECS